MYEDDDEGEAQTDQEGLTGAAAVLAPKVWFWLYFVVVVVVVVVVVGVIFLSAAHMSRWL